MLRKFISHINLRNDEKKFPINSPVTYPSSFKINAFTEKKVWQYQLLSCDHEKLVWINRRLLGLTKL